MKNILFVCTGNTCRSPMAEIILKNILKSASNTQIKISSCGLNVTEGLPISEYSKLALKSLGLKLTAKKSKQINEKLVKKANIVICMTQAQKEYLNKYNNVFTFNELTQVGEIVDPYGQTLDNYICCAKQLLRGCTSLFFNLIKDNFN